MKPIIRAVTFDVGGTLIQPWPSVGHVYADEVARHGWPDISPENLNQNFHSAWRGRDRNFNHSEEEWAALVDQIFAGMADPPPSRSFFPALYERFAREGLKRRSRKPSGPSAANQQVVLLLEIISYAATCCPNLPSPISSVRFRGMSESGLPERVDEKISKHQLSCLVEALRATREELGGFAGLPAGSLHRIGGLMPETAAMVESVIHRLTQSGNDNVSIPQIMAEIDAQDQIQY